MTHITVNWNVILTLGIRVACNQAGVKLYKWHHLVRSQLVHTIGGFMMTGTWAKAMLRGYQNGLASTNPSTVLSFGRNVNWCSHLGKIVWRFLKKLKIELPYNPAIPLLGIYSKKIKILSQKDISTHMFTALFTIAKTWKQPKCPSVDE